MHVLSEIINSKTIQSKVLIQYLKALHNAFVFTPCLN